MLVTFRRPEVILPLLPSRLSRFVCFTLTLLFLQRLKPLVSKMLEMEIDMEGFYERLNHRVRP